MVQGDGLSVRCLLVSCHLGPSLPLPAEPQPLSLVGQLKRSICNRAELAGVGRTHFWGRLGGTQCLGWDSAPTFSFRTWVAPCSQTPCRSLPHSRSRPCLLQVCHCLQLLPEVVPLASLLSLYVWAGPGETHADASVF